jgi:DNA-binding NarL/FixJ family response regulator
VKPIRVVLADDHELVLEGLRSFLDAQDDVEVLAAVTSGEQLLDAVRLHHPDVVTLDLELGGMSGLTCLELLRAEGLTVRVLVLTAYSDGASLRGALERGADGYALKTDSPQQTVQALRQVFHGQLVFPVSARRWLIGDRAPRGKGRLTEREQAVLNLVAEGVTNGEIARRLRVSENTVKFHLQNLYLKLGVSNRTEAATLFLRRGASPE